MTLTDIIASYYKEAGFEVSHDKGYNHSGWNLLSISKKDTYFYRDFCVYSDKIRIWGTNACASATDPGFFKRLEQWAEVAWWHNESELTQ